VNRTTLGRRLRRGLVIPAHPLALTARRRLDERRQLALSRYYLAAGAGGLAAGVHTTEFAIRKPGVGLLQPVLELAAIAAREPGGTKEPPVMIAGICGKTPQAVREARLARDLHYQAGLVSLAQLPDATTAALLDHMRAVGEILPVFGFYLQQAVGGRPLGETFWRRLLELESLVAIKVAPFDRYRTLAVRRAVAESGRRDVALYTGNDDHIILDLLAPGPAPFRGGLLGQWAVWTSRAVRDLARCRRATSRGRVPTSLLRYADDLTRANAAIFDAANGFSGVIPGIHEVLRRMGLLRGRWCLDPSEDLSPGQAKAIDRIWRELPHLRDDAFVEQHLDTWLS
jgi:dihydrodipicolinate synthase/N-acetylneuraminate lyase